jgi:hypothetical protein
MMWELSRADLAMNSRIRRATGDFEAPGGYAGRMLTPFPTTFRRRISAKKKESRK